jgi:hypothetical protein
MAGMMPRMPAAEERLTFETPKGPVTGAFASPARGARVLVIAHGAGAGLDHPFLVGFSRARTSTST